MSEGFSIRVTLARGRRKVGDSMSGLLLSRVDLLSCVRRFSVGNVVGPLCSDVGSPLLILSPQKLCSLSEGLVVGVI
jgi:hypothetical protein